MNLPAQVTDWPQALRTKHADQLARRLKREYGIQVGFGGNYVIDINKLVGGLTREDVVRVIRRVSDEVACELDPKRIQKVGVGS